MERSAQLRAKAAQPNFAFGKLSQQEQIAYRNARSAEKIAENEFMREAKSEYDQQQARARQAQEAKLQDMTNYQEEAGKVNRKNAMEWQAKQAKLAQEAREKSAASAQAYDKQQQEMLSKAELSRRKAQQLIQEESQPEPSLWNRISSIWTKRKR